MPEIRPNPGPQEDFLACSADVAIYGGQAGGGKTFALTVDPLRWVGDRDFGGVIFRRQSVDLVGSGSIWEEAQKIYPLIGAKSRESPNREWRFPSGSLIEFRHLKEEADKFDHQGKQYGFIGFDELTHFTEGQFWYMVSRLRSIAGLHAYIRATCNPDPDSFVRLLIDWWIGEDGYPIFERSGVLRWFVRDGDELFWFDSREEAVGAYPNASPMSLTFIAAGLADNPKGDPDYKARLEVLPRVERERLLGGNWNVRAISGEVFKRSWYSIIDHLDPKLIVSECRAWDLAASEVSPKNKDPDWTAGVKVAKLKDGTYVIRHVERGRWSPAKVRKNIETMAEQDGKKCQIRLPQDPGQAGKDQAQQYVRDLAGKGYTIRIYRPTGDKITYANPVSALAEQGMMKLIRGPWNEAFLNELEAFPTPGVHDDQVDGQSHGVAALIRPVVRYNPSDFETVGYES